MSKRHIYLHTLPVEEALALVQTSFSPEAFRDLVKTQVIPSQLAAGRVLSQAVTAKYSSPTFHAAAMDGYAVCAKDTFRATEASPLRLEIGTKAMLVNTGHPLPAHCDAVVMIEQVQEHADHIILESAAYPCQHVRRIGEDIVATELLFTSQHELKAWDIAALLTGGIWEVEVYEQLQVGIIPTGDEVLDFDLQPEPKAGQVIESNSQMLKALLHELHCQVHCYKTVPDQPALLHAALKQSLQAHHLTLICAGSSAGSKDFTRQILSEQGQLLVHGLNVMPGKPTLVGKVENRLVIGVPGYPVSALVAFKELITPIITWLSRKTSAETQTLPATLTRSVVSRPGIEEHIRLALGQVGQKIMATPLGRGAGNISTVCKSQGLLRLPANSEGISEASPITTELWVPRSQLKQTLVCVGSHDNLLDLLADKLMHKQIHLSSTHVGSMGGINALRSESCHLAGMHMFDLETQDFNFPYLQKFLPQTRLTVINLSIRQQGLIVAKNNPLNIRDLHDLSRIRFINRQRGSGTRILLDYHLNQAQLAGVNINGYAKEEFTHMAVAVNVLTGAADAGLGIYAAAKALDLDFIPLAKERYDLIFPTSLLDDWKIQALLEIMNSQDFQQQVLTQGGYELNLIGQIMQPA